MISLFHLFWIVPVTFLLGYIACALLSANGRENDA